jgi:hypothetical protein
MRRAAVLWALALSACVVVKAPDSARVLAAPTTPSDPAREVLVTFVQAVKTKQFQVAYGCVSARWHRRYASVEAFAADRALSGLAPERVERLAQALETAPVVTVGTNASLALSDTRATFLLKQGDDWVIDELDGAITR